jgi:hypothetical protein
MAKKEKEQQYLALQSMFESNHVKKMRDIEKLYPTMIAADMGMNHGRYIRKLYNPEDFTIKQVLKLASLININPSVLINIIVTEVTGRPKKTVR